MTYYQDNSNKKVARDYFDRAEAALKEARQQDAVKWYAASISFGYTQAAVELKSIAYDGDVNAQLALGYLYQQGKGLKKDINQSVLWYSQAIQQNSADAYESLSLLAETESCAQYALGNAYEMGYSVEKNIIEAIAFYKKAVSQKDKKALKRLEELANAEQFDAQFALAEIYAEGLGVVCNKAAAVTWYKRAAEQGSGYAEYCLGMLYGSDQSVATNSKKESIYYYQLAVKKGYMSALDKLTQLSNKRNKGACVALAQLYEFGEVAKIEKDVILAANCYVKALKYGFLEALDCLNELVKREENSADSARLQFILAESYRQGYVTNPNDTLAIKWYAQSVKQGNKQALLQLKAYAESNNADAQFTLAGIIGHGNRKNVVKDFDCAVKLYYLAATNKHKKAFAYLLMLSKCNVATAQFFLGKLYEADVTQPEYLQDAVLQYKKAASQGNVEALEHLKSLSNQNNVYAQSVFGELYHKLEENKLKEYCVKQCYQAALQDYPPAIDALKVIAKENNMAQYYLAKLYVKQGELFEEKAIHWYMLSANNGYAMAQYELANFYLQGDGVEEDKEKAILFYQKAADQGICEASHKLGELLYIPQQQDCQQNIQALDWYAKALSQGMELALDELIRIANQNESTYAKYVLGDIYYHGNGIPRDPAVGLEWYLKADEMGNQDVAKKIAKIYYNGDVGIDKNINQAINFYYKSAKFQDNESLNFLNKLARCKIAYAQFLLAQLYESGDAGKKDLDNAIGWYIKAAYQNHQQSIQKIQSLSQQGNTEAQCKLADWLLRQDGDHGKEAILLYEQSANEDCTKAQYKVARLYLKGIKGIEKDIDKAAYYFYQAASNKCKKSIVSLYKLADSGTASAQYYLGKLRGNKESHLYDSKKSMQWYIRSAKQHYKAALEMLAEMAASGDIHLLNVLGDIYYNQPAEKRDLPKAIFWYEKAAENNISTAQYKLACLYHSGGEGVVADQAKAVNWYVKAFKLGVSIASVRLFDMAKAGILEAQNAVANEFYEKNDIEKAIFWYEKAAEKGHKAALTCLHQIAYTGNCDVQFILAKFYHHGEGVPSNVRKAIYWYRRSASLQHSEALAGLHEISDLGNIHASFCLANLYNNSEFSFCDKQKASSLYLTSAKKGYAEAQYKLARLSEKNSLTSHNQRKIICLDLKAACQGYKKSIDQLFKSAKNSAEYQYALALFYSRLNSTCSDNKKIFSLYYKAAKQNQVKAQYKLAKIYHKGNLKKVANRRAAIRWYIKAIDNNHCDALSQLIQIAEKGDAYAQYSLGGIYLKLTSADPDERKAVYWYSRAAEQNQLDAQHELAKIYHHGLTDVQVDLDKAAKLYYQMALEDCNRSFESLLELAENDHLQSQYLLGQLFENNSIRQFDLVRARFWYHKAAEQGNPNAQQKIATFLHYGIGGKINKEDAVVWYQKAHENNVPRSTQGLQALMHEGSLNATIALGDIYSGENDQGHHRQIALCFYQKAAQQGCKQALAKLKELAQQDNIDAQRMLGDLYKDKINIDDAIHQAIDWYQRAIKSGDIQSQYQLANCYFELWRKSNKKSQQQFSQGLYWLNNAAELAHVDARAHLCSIAEQGYSEAQYLLAGLYENDLSLNNHLQQSAFWYQKAADQGHLPSQKKIAFFFCCGMGVDKDVQQAEYWYHHAAEQGDQEALSELSTIKLLQQSSS